MGDMLTANPITGAMDPVLRKYFLPDPSLSIEILPENNGPFIYGYPGLTPFSVRAVVRVTNTAAKKHKNIHTLKVEFTGQTLVRGDGFAFEMHLERKLTLVEPPDAQNTYKGGAKATGKSRLPPLAPHETRDFSIVFDFASPAQGGPSYLPSSMLKPYGSEDARTRYGFDVKVYTPSKFSSDPNCIGGSVDVPFYWFDPQQLSNLYLIQTLEPKPGWINGIPNHLPPSAGQVAPHAPISLDLTFVHGLSFDINGPIHFTLRVAPKSNNPITVKSFSLTVEQTILTLGAGQTKGPIINSDVFKYQYTRKPQDDLTHPHHFTTIFKDPEDTGYDSLILPTRNKRGLDKHFIVRHELKVAVKLVGANDVELKVPCTVVPWNRDQVLGFMTHNPDIVREVVNGVAPAYTDAPAYSAAPGYDSIGH
ncbi:hypothetical protein HDV00_002611 [Rhizophlyctis rosea]|nr:hypothetical protein HDV00_002611 [Rhizophlyctis rosea]